jgi:hypothetical protein
MSRRSVHPGSCLLALLIGSAASHAAEAQNRHPPRSPDELLWAEIDALSAESAAAEPDELNPSTAPDRRVVDPERARRQRLLDRLELYLRLYPGGPRRDEAVALELQTAFEIGVLAGGRFDDLCGRVASYCRAPPSPAALHEAAWWRIICRRVESAASATGEHPASRPPIPTMLPGHDPALLREYQSYLEEHPDSRRAPRVAEILFEEALRRGDRPAMRRVLERLAGAQREHPITERLTAQLRRQEAVGRSFDVRLRLADGSTWDIRTERGRIVILVVWASFHAGSRERLRQVWELAQQDHELRLIGVNLDFGAEEMRAACGGLGVDCPQVHDGRGWAGAFALEWGVRQIPFVFVVDREGRLVGATAGEDWRGLLERARPD